MILGLGFIGYYLSSFLSFLVLHYIPATLERLLLYLTPTIVVVLSVLLFKEGVGQRHVLALGLSDGGIMLVVGDDLSVHGPANVDDVRGHSPHRRQSVSDVELDWPCVDHCGRGNRPRRTGYGNPADRRSARPGRRGHY
jgi:hypothetical protein